MQTLSPAEQRVARYFQDNREEVLVGSAAALAEMAATSDATVIRTAKALGYDGLDDLRRALARDLRSDLSPASRLTRTLSDADGDHRNVFQATIETHIQALEQLQRSITAEQFARVVECIIGARATVAFGIGPSSAMADYLTIQLGRFGLEARSLTHTGLLLADGISKLKHDDVLIIFAYTHPYTELDALLDRANKLEIATILITDTLADQMRKRVKELLIAPRGRAGMMSMHAATLALIEAILVGIAARRPTETIASLKLLNALRTKVTGTSMDLPSRDKRFVSRKSQT